MKKLALSIFLFSFLMIAFSCSSIELDEKQAELDRNRALWQSQGVEHYRFNRIILPCLCDQIAAYPHVIYVSNNKVCSITIETNNFDERDFDYISNLWQNNRYLISNTLEFSTNYLYSQNINERFNDIQNFINEAKNDVSINGLLNYHNYIIDVNYDQEYGYPVEMRLNKTFTVVADAPGYPIISNLQILD